MMCQGYTAKGKSCWRKAGGGVRTAEYCGLHWNAPPARKAAWKIRRANQAHQDRADSEPFE